MRCALGAECSRQLRPFIHDILSIERRCSFSALLRRIRGEGFRIVRINEYERYAAAAEVVDDGVEAVGVSVGPCALVGPEDEDGGRITEPAGERSRAARRRSEERRVGKERGSGGP